MKFFSKFFIALLLLGFLLRIIIMFWSFNFRENTDILRHRDRANIAHVYGLKEAYKTDHLTFGTLGNNMPPGALYLDVLSYEGQIPLVKAYLKITNQPPGSNLWINSVLINTFLRLPAIIADLILGFLIYKVVKSKRSEKLALFASSLFVFNPVVLYNSAFWGQMDSRNYLFFFAAILFLLKDRIFPSILSYSLSLYLKLSLLPLLPFFVILMYLRNQNKKIHIILSALGSIIVILILTLPLSERPHEWLFQFLSKNSLGEMQHITNFALNFWWFVFKPFILIGKLTDLFTFSEIRLIGSPLSQNTLFGLSLNSIAILLFLISSIPLTLRAVLLKKYKKEDIFLFFSILALFAFLFLPKMHERYMYPIFAPLAAYIGLKGKFIFIFIFLSILNFINIYLVWHPMRPLLLPYELMTSIWFQWTISGLILVTAAIFYLKYRSMEK